MIERPRKISMFKTPQSRERIFHNETEAIIKSTETHLGYVFEKLHTLEDIFGLINKNPEITVIRWTIYEDKSVQIALYSFNMSEKGHGGCSLSQIDFDELQRKAPARIRFEFVGRH